MEDVMATATERIPVLVTKTDKIKFSKKAKLHGLSISEFARAAMEQFNPGQAEEEEAIEPLLKQVKDGTALAERSLTEALEFCAGSNARLARLDKWMREHGYA
jgi:hypothetical protein